MSAPCRPVTLAGLVVLAALFVFAAPAGARSSVPWFGQKNASDCGRAVLASLAARRGGNPDTYYRKLPDPPDPRGYSIAEMRRYAGRVGVGLSLAAPAGVVIAGDCSDKPPVAAHMARLARAAASGRPVVVPVSRGFGSGHYLILIGASGDSFTVLDPAAPGARSMTRSELAASMCGYGYIALMAH